MSFLRTMLVSTMLLSGIAYAAERPESLTVCNKIQSETFQIGGDTRIIKFGKCVTYDLRDQKNRACMHITGALEADWCNIYLNTKEYKHFKAGIAMYRYPMQSVSEYGFTGFLEPDTNDIINLKTERENPNGIFEITERQLVKK